MTPFLPDTRQVCICPNSTTSTNNIQQHRNNVQYSNKHSLITQIKKLSSVVEFFPYNCVENNTCRFQILSSSF